MYMHVTPLFHDALAYFVFVLRCCVPCFTKFSVEDVEDLRSTAPECAEHQNIGWEGLR